MSSSSSTSSTTRSSFTDQEFTVTVVGAFGGRTLSLGCRRGQLEPEGRARARWAVDSDHTAVRGDDLPGDEQAQPGAARGLVGATSELLEHPRLLLDGHARAGVGHLEADAVLA